MVGVIDANLVVVSEFLPCDVDVHWHLQTKDGWGGVGGGVG